MTRTISASDAESQFATVLGWVQDNQDAVIVESHGAPAAVLISYDEYEKIQTMKEQARRQEAFARLEQLREQVSARNRDLSEEEALALTDRLVRETIEEMAQEGKITFESE